MQQSTKIFLTWKKSFKINVLKHRQINIPSISEGQKMFLPLECNLAPAAFCTQPLRPQDMPSPLTASSSVLRTKLHLKEMTAQLFADYEVVWHISRWDENLPGCLNKDFIISQAFPLQHNENKSFWDALILPKIP